MTFMDKLRKATTDHDSQVCVGLDPDLELMPPCVMSEPNPIYTFCSEIIEHTSDIAAAFKLNFAFFEAEGLKGWQALEMLLDRIPEGVLTIADAKRADIGNSSQKYAESILQRLNFDSVTVSPYMGKDSVEPFIQWPEKGAFVLALTSNPGSHNFQHLQISARPLYKKVIKEVMKWNRHNNCGLVVGATHPSELESVRNLAPGLPFLIPGVGAQGGSLEAAVKNGTDTKGGLALINSSRGIIYKSHGSDFARAARAEVESLNRQIRALRHERDPRVEPTP